MISTQGAPVIEFTHEGDSADFNVVLNPNTDDDVSTSLVQVRATFPFDLTIVGGDEFTLKNAATGTPTYPLQINWKAHVGAWVCGGRQQVKDGQCPAIYDDVELIGGATSFAEPPLTRSGVLFTLAGRANAYMLRGWLYPGDNAPQLSITLLFLCNPASTDGPRASVGSLIG